jgi:hypothetical protein
MKSLCLRCPHSFYPECITRVSQAHIHKRIQRFLRFGQKGATVIKSDKNKIKDDRRNVLIISLYRFVFISLITITPLGD